MPPQDLQTLLALFLRDLYAGTVGLTSGVGLSLTDGTASANSGGLQFAAEPTTRLWRSAAGQITIQGSLAISGANITVPAASQFKFLGRGSLNASADGSFFLWNNGGTSGTRLKVDALPTIASGFGTSPAVTAGSTPMAGSVDVGTGGAATSGVITFNGAAFSSAPFVVVTTKLTNAVTRVSAISTTQMTLSSTTAWTANDIISWVCFGAQA